MEKIVLREGSGDGAQMEIDPGTLSVYHLGCTYARTEAQTPEGRVVYVHACPNHH
jgi:hypothetical protein